MEILVIIGVIIFALIGIIGAIVPGLPGPPISYVSLLLLLLLPNYVGEPIFLTIMGVLAVGITLLDYFVPIYGTKKFGGTKMGVWGSTIGMIVGVFVLPLLGIIIGPFGILGIILGPFVGAYLGELCSQNKENALRAAIGSFIGFLLGTFAKVAYGLVVIVVAVKEIISYYW